MLVPGLLLRRLYTVGSLRNTELGVEFSIKNRLGDARLTALRSVRIDGLEVPPERLRLRVNGRLEVGVAALLEQAPIAFPLRQSLDIVAGEAPLPQGEHAIEVAFDCEPFGSLKLEVSDAIAERPAARRIPRDPEDDYGETIIGERQAFVQRQTGRQMDHTKHYSFDPHRVSGNCEHFIGVAQVPLGVAGPIRINGEHAQGEFLIPLATSEGTLIASYNRGMQALNLSGGVICTVVADAMQRAPVFIFENARRAREFIAWTESRVAEIRAAAEATSRVARLQYLDPYQSHKFVFLRFNFSTGDAAGQNMVSRATAAACAWIVEHFDGVQRFFLESNLATDKKASQINTLKTRGKRVTAEAVVKREVLRERLRVAPEALADHYRVSTVGSFLAGANNNGLHAANAIAAMFIATGQDAGNVAESSAGIIYTEVTAEGDLYLSITLPSLIVATYGGGTHLATQRECLEMLDCCGPGKVNKLAEIVAGVVLAGELSLAAAISSADWVPSHERLGRNR